MKKIKNKCAKCGTDCKKEGTFLTEGGEVFYFCALCYLVLEKMEGCQRVHLFLNDNFSQFLNDISPIDKSMILARINRSQGVNPWSKLN